MEPCVEMYFRCSQDLDCFLVGLNGKAQWRGGAGKGSQFDTNQLCLGAPNSIGAAASTAADVGPYNNPRLTTSTELDQ